VCCSQESYEMKMSSICNLKSEIIFLCDIRLGELGGGNGGASHKVTTTILKSKLNGHIFIHNSTGQKRGVAILISKHLEPVILDEYKDQMENILLIKVRINGNELVLGSLYGPNATDRTFYRGITDFLTKHQSVPVLLGGDWNVTWDTSPPESNIDIYQMARPPNIANSRMLHALADFFELTDPYRVLHPTRKAYSYQPFGTQRKNQSRIDFFLVSSSLLNNVVQCEIFPSQLTKQFDHKPISIVLGKTEFIINKGLKNWYLDDELVKMSTELSVLQIFLNAIDNRTPEDINYNQILTNAVNMLSNIFRQCLKLRETIDSQYGNENTYEKLLLAARIREHKLIMEELPDWEILNSLSKRCNDKEFFTALTDRISEKVSGTQQKLNKFKNIRKKKLLEKHDELSKNYDENSDDIRICERELKEILNVEAARILSKQKIFENLTFEKPTERFLSIAKNIGKGDSLLNIKDENGVDFESKNTLNEHIKNFYSNLYRKDEGVEGEIEDFLGEEICQHPLVSNSKLTPLEKEKLEQDLKIDELDVALNESNLKSAPGIDGFSNLFISKFWYLLKIPFFKCCKACLSDGSLIETFATAQIKLIPKKGDTTKIKNWRPISLLSNFYKILSRAVNNRLKTVVNRVLSRAQKGFTKSRQIQEVILNLSETIDYCKRANIKGAVICVDQMKAFDSVDHGYMEKVFKFFGFGENFVRWLKTIGTGRKACVILEGGEKSTVFDLLKGTAQGDCPSPIIYNICAQILIFKIELDPTITRINQRANVADNRRGGGAAVFSYESNYETGKNESFADDSTTCTLFRYEDLWSLKNILEKFSKLSGLKCNFEKTSIMRVGNLEGDTDPRILELGFEIVDECKLLGYIIEQNGNLTSKNGQKTLEKVQKTINFWKIFNLSVSGKITIVKSTVLPLIIYYVTILNFEKHILDSIQCILESFVCDGINISKDKIYENVDKGGLGLIYLPDFIIAIQSTWVKRVLDLKHDNWRNTVFLCCEDGPTFIQEEDLETLGDTLAAIMKNFIIFRNRYGAAHNNFRRVPILNNQIFEFGKAANRVIFNNFFFRNNNIAIIRRITWDHLTDLDTFKTREEINRSLSINLTVTQYNKLKQGFGAAKRNFYKEGDSCVKIEDFLRGFKKGSKKLRIILGKDKTLLKKRKCPISNHMKIAGIEGAGPDLNKNLNARWTKNYYTSEMRTFLFKFYRNTVGLNYRVNHINPDRDQSCTFCVKSKNLPAARESFNHFFWDCPTTGNIISNMLRMYFNTDPFKEFFTGTYNENIFSEVHCIIYDTCKYVLWQFKLKRRLPNIHSFADEVNYLIIQMRMSCKKLDNIFDEYEMYRNRRDERGRER
jgi:exonuclease III